MGSTLQTEQITKSAVHFCPSALQTSVELVDLEAVDLADGFPLTYPNSRLQRGHGRLLTFPLAEVKLAVVHHRVVVVVEGVFSLLLRHQLEVLTESGHYVLPVDLHKVVAIGSRLLVIYSNGVHQLMHYPSLAAEAVGAGVVGPLKGHHLFATPPTHVGPASLGSFLGRLDQQVVLHFSVVGNEAHAGQRVEGFQGLDYGFSLLVHVTRTDLEGNRSIRPKALRVSHGIHPQS